MEAQKTKSGKYRARGFNKYTRARPSFTADSKKEARRQAELYSMQCKDDSGGKLTLEDAIDLHIMSHRNLWTSERTEKTYKGYKKKYDYLLPKKLDMITDRVMQDWVNDMSRKYSPKYIKNLFSFLAQIKKDYGGCTAINVDRPKVVKPNLNLPAEADVVRYLAFVESVQDDEHMGNMTVPAYLATFTAMRRGEIAGLAVRDINFISNTIRIHRAMAESKNGGWYFKPPKNGQERTITVPRIVIEKIIEYGLPELNPSQLSKRQAMIQKANGDNFGLHALRHYCASRLLSLGCPIADVAEYGGWTDVKVLMEIYNYVINESRRQTTEKWNRYAEELSTKIEKSDQLVTTSSETA